MIALDASAIIALIDGRDRNHAAVAGWYRDVDEPTWTTPLALAEVDLVLPRAGPAAIRAFRKDLIAGAFPLEGDPELVRRAAEVAEAYADLGVSLTDGSLVALADRLGTTSIATLDERHFRAMRPLSGGPAFTLLPADAA
ncbi:MAG: PIN domain-containing protein [Solirubrobacterales bacterium]|nr:PIN domain-containing protein [Solirubrobacterales bacterium]